MQVKKIIVCILIIFSSFAHGSNDQLIKNEQTILMYLNSSYKSYTIFKKHVLKIIHRLNN